MRTQYERVKVFVVSARHPGEVLVLEKHRDDLPGGHIDRGEGRRETAEREGREELCGTRLKRLTRIPSAELRRALGKAVTTDTAFYAAYANFPLDNEGNDIVSVNPDEHSGARWESRVRFLGGTAPRIYKIAIQAGERIFQELENRHAMKLGIEYETREAEAVSA